MTSYADHKQALKQMREIKHVCTYQSFKVRDLDKHECGRKCPAGMGGIIHLNQKDSDLGILLQCALCYETRELYGEKA